MRMRVARKLSALMWLFLILGLVSCGGGGGQVADNGVGSGGTGAPVGIVELAVTDAPGSGFDHVWITIREIRFHASNGAGPDEPGWLAFPLPKPVTVDLATLNNGALSQVLSTITLPAGTYKQIRLLLAGDNEALTESASAQSLKYNDQIDYSDGGVSRSLPLEIANPAQGISVLGAFKVVAGQTLHLAFDFNIGNDVVKIRRHGVDAFTLKPRLTYYDLDHAATITGKVDMASVAGAGAGAFDLSIKAVVKNAAGDAHDVVRTTSLRSDGTFTLYPVLLPLNKTTGSLDVLIRGRNMETLIIKDVPVSEGTVTALSPHALTVTAAREYTAGLNGGPLSPSGGWVRFSQTLPGSGELPYEVQFRHVNPFTGGLSDPVELANAALNVATYGADTDPVFHRVNPVEGAGGYLALGGAPGFSDTPADSAISPPAAGSGPVNVALPDLQPVTGVALNRISGRILQLTPGRYDAGYLVVSRDGLISTTLDIAAQLGQRTGGSYVLPRLAGGTAAEPLPGAVYYGYVIVWNSADPWRSLHVKTLSGHADLRQGSVTGFDVTLN